MEAKQNRLWLIAALTVPAVHFSGGGWLTTLVTAAAVLPLTIVKKDWTFSRPMALVQILWLGIVAGSLLPYSAVCWPSDNALTVPVVLLTLAALTRASGAPRIGAVLAFSMGLLALPIAISGAANLNLSRLRPTLSGWEPMLALVLLASALPAGGVRKGRDVLTVGVLIAAFTVLIQGVLSQSVAVRLPDPEYQTARTLGYLEPVASAAMTLGWYSIASWLFTSSAEIAGKCNMGERLPYVLVWGTATTVVAVRWQLPAPFLMVLSTVLWCFAPFFQKLKKVKNSA